MRLLPVKRICLFLSLTCFSQVASASNTLHTSETFSFELFHTNVACWRDGTCKGLVNANAKGEMAEALDQFLSSAENDIDMAIYGVYRQDWFLTKLRKLRARGVNIRAVVDQAHGALNDWVPKNFSYPDTAYLPKALGLKRITPDVDPVGKPRAGSIMHNKFFVIDKKKTWIGSTNISHTCLGAEYNANNALIIHSPTVAAIFNDEFAQMFESHQFSIYKRSTFFSRKTSTVHFKDGTRVNIFFSPQDNPVETAVVPFINGAKKSLEIAMFYLTDKRVADAMIKAVKRGVHVRLIQDALAAAHPASRHGDLQAGGVDLRVENLGGKMHMKSAIADDHKVLIGSMNWTAAGTVANDENLVTIENNRELAAQSLAYFEDLWEHLPDPKTSREPLRPAAESHYSINSCSDGIDNDHDGLVDEEDPMCRPNYQWNPKDVKVHAFEQYAPF